MKAFVTGGTGFLGRALVDVLLAQGNDVIVVSRRSVTPWGDRVRMIRGDPTEPGDWQRAVDGQDVVIHLTGTPVVDLPLRWTSARKALLRSSRVDATVNVADAIRRATSRPTHLISSSAVGYYGDRGDQRLDEHATAGDDFLARLCLDWERAAEAVGDITRVTRLRSAPVVGPGGGMVEPMLVPFKLGLGGPWGPGTQWLPWIHRDDWVRAVMFVLQHEMDGPVNVTAPEPVTVNAFAKALGAALNRPAIVPVPTLALKLALGEQATVLLASERVDPRRLREAGFAWESKTLQEALERSLKSGSTPAP